MTVIFGLVNQLPISKHRAGSFPKIIHSTSKG